MKRRPNKLPSTGANEGLVRLAATGLTMLERALSTAQSLWSQLSGKDAEPSEVYGCKGCRLIYAPRVYHLGCDVSSINSHCPRCCSPWVESLGPLPLTTENSQGVYLIGSLDEAPLGPFESMAEAHDNLWTWFETKEHHDGHKEQEDPQDRGKIIRLTPKADRPT